MCVEPVVVRTQSCQNHLAGHVKKVVCILLLSGFQCCFDDGGLVLVMDAGWWLLFLCQLVYWCEVWSAVWCVLVTSRFQSPPLGSPTDLHGSRRRSAPRHVACQVHRRVDLPWCTWTGPQLWVNSAAALWLPCWKKGLTENYLVLPGQVLQPETKGGVTPTENLESWSQQYWAIRRSLTDHSTMHKSQSLHD